MANRREPSPELRALVAFGQQLREGIELVRKSRLGTIVVLGHAVEHDSLIAGGDVVDQRLTADAIQRAARDDGATVLNTPLDRIVRKHTRLEASPTIPVVSLGTRHTAAERYAKQTGRAVIAVSEERHTATLFVGESQYQLRPLAELRREADELVWSLRAIRDLVAKDGQARPAKVDEASGILDRMAGHLVELGETAVGIRSECATIAAAIGIDQPIPIPPSRDFIPSLPEPATSDEAARNAFHGTARNVVQAGRIDAVHLSLAPVELPTPRQLPPPVRHFIGRETQLAQVFDALSSDRTETKIAVIMGAAGIGKSAFAVQCGHKAESAFTDGVLYTDLRGFDPVNDPADPVDVLDVFLRDLGVPEAAVPTSLSGMTGLYRSVLHGKRVLIILDNARDARQVRPLLPGTTTCGVLVTGRTALPSLASNDGAQLIKLELLPPKDSVALLRRLATEYAADPRLDELAALCGHHPLALCVAGTLLAAWWDGDLEGFLDGLRRERLDTLSDPDDPAASVRASFSLSYKALPANAQRAFRLLGIAPGPTIPAAVALMLAEDGDALRRLVNAHLVERVGHGHYRFHDLVRTYATECANHAETTEARDKALCRLLDWYLRTAQAQDRVLDPWRTRAETPPGGDGTSGPDLIASSAPDWFDDELANIAAAVHAAHTRGHHDMAWQLALAPSAYFFTRKPWGTWILTQETGLAAARADGAQAGEAWLCDGLGVAYREQAQHGTALTHFDRAVAVFRALGDVGGEAEATLHLAQAYREHGDTGRALDLTMAAQALFGSAGLDHGTAKAANLLGGLYAAQGDFAVALTHTERAVSIFAGLGDEYSHGWAVNNLAAVFAKQGRRAESISAFRAAMAVRRRVDRYGLGFTLQGLGDVLHEAGDLREAVIHWQEAFAIFDAIGDPRAAVLRAKLDAVVTAS